MDHPNDQDHQADRKEVSIGLVVKARFCQIKFASRDLLVCRSIHLALALDFR